MTIERVDVNKYSLFEDMIYWRENGTERSPAGTSISEQMKNELNNPNLYIYMQHWKMDDMSVGFHLYIFRKLDSDGMGMVIFMLMNYGLNQVSEEKVLLRLL